MDSKWLARIADGLLPLSFEAMDKADKHLRQKLKPVGSLGKLEKIAVKLAGIYGFPLPDISAKAIVMMAADHGVYEEGISDFPQELSGSLAELGDAGLLAVNVLARQVGAHLEIVDVGLKGEINGKRIIRKKIKKGTANFAHGPAMSRKELWKAIRVGFEVTASLIQDGIQVLGMGEIGLGNTTASAAVLAAFTGCSPREVVGVGTCRSEQTYLLKVQTVERALTQNRPDPQDTLDVLAKVGGLEIAALVGSCLAAAYHRKPLVIDGFIAGIAALAAVRMTPLVKEYLFPSHLSAEKGAQLVLDLLGMEPMLLMEMRLGEGTGAALAFPILDAALKIYHEMGTFAEIAKKECSCS